MDKHWDNMRKSAEEQQENRLRDKYPELYGFVKSVIEGKECPRSGNSWFRNDILQFENHFEITVRAYWNNYVTDGYDDVKKEFLPDLPPPTCIAFKRPPKVGIRHENKVYICSYACELYKYPADLHVLHVIELDSNPQKAEEQFQRIKWLGSVERQQRLLQEKFEAHDASVQKFYKEHIVPVYQEFKELVEELTAWYFKEGWLTSFGTPKCDWIDIPQLAKSGHWSIVEFIMESEHFFDDETPMWLEKCATTEDGKPRSREDQFFEALGDDCSCDLDYQMFHDFFPYFKSVFKMVNSNAKGEGYPNGDCFCGTKEEEANRVCGIQLLIFAWDHIYAKKYTRSSQLPKSPSKKT